jgi:DnaJ-domain-containing protein 1
MNHWYAHERRLHAAAEAFAAGEARKASGDWTRRQREREPETAESAALKVLGLTPPVDYAEIRARYIALVKQNHPDANGGDKDAEERLKTINQALSTLKSAYLA